MDGTVTPSTNVAFQGHHVKNSPFFIEKVGEEYLLCQDHAPSIAVRLVERPAFLDNRTSEDIPVWKIASFHGSDAIGVTIDKNCYYWRNKQQCKFCAIEQKIKTHSGKSLATKTPQQVSDAIEAAVESGFCHHVTLTTGVAETPDRGATPYIPILREIRRNLKTPVHVQLEPPQDLEMLGRLYEEGADTVGLHIESLDEKVKRRVCPGKPPDRVYFEAWKYAEKTFGQNQVSTFILVGLGEDPKLTDRRLENVTSAGAIPFVTPFRPLLGTELENEDPPNPLYLLGITEKAVVKMKDSGMKPNENRAGCVRCGACSAIMEAF